MGRRAITVMVCGAAIVTIAMGVRQSFGIFLRPISMDLGIGREAFAFAVAVQNLMFGLAQPAVGMIADRWGAGRVVAGGAALYVLGLVLTTVSGDPLVLTATLGALVGVGLSGNTYVPVLGAVGRAVPAEQRTRAFGLVTAAGSFGMFAVVPGSQALLTQFGWHTAFLALAVLVALTAVLAIGVSGRPDPHAAGAQDQTALQALTEAGCCSGYWLLNAGFFVCGFHIAFVATHLPAYLADNQMSPETSANALAMIGLFNIIGSYTFGAIGTRWRKKYLLSGLYFARALLFAAFLVLPLTPVTAVVFGAAIGFLWLATVPLTSGMVVQMFGPRYLSMLYGVVFLWHQVGSFLGVWLGGFVYDRTGSYDIVWLASVGLGVMAALIHLPIIDAPVRRLLKPAE